MSYAAGSGISRWWASIKRLPGWGPGLISLMTPTIGVLAGKMPVVPNVSWCAETDTAYADRSRQLIVIGSRIFSDYASDRINPDASKEHAVEACLGLVVHEGMHFIYSPHEISGLLNSGVPLNQQTALIANVVEDVFIEYQAAIVEKSYGWMISSLWEYYWPEASMSKKISEAWDGESRDVKGILKTMVMWKNQDFDFSFRSPFEEELFRALYSVRGMLALQDRKDLIEKIYRLIFTEKEISEQEGERKKGKEAGEGKEGDEAFDTFDVLGKPVKLSAKPAPSFTVFNRDNIVFSDYGAASNAPYVFKNIEPCSYNDFVLQEPRKWDALAKWQLDVGSVRQHRGTPGNYGRLTHPSRLYDDGKIFSKVQKSSPSGRVEEGGSPQTILLIDFSGSMNGGVKGKRQSKFKAALHVAGGVGKALSQAKHRIAVYGHTTSGRGLTEVCEISTVKTFSESVQTMFGRLSALDEVGAMNNNMDATAIEAVAKKFKFDGSPCRLFVVSDGQPSCSLYSGNSGVEITKEAVNKLRKQGVEIYSLCIDPSAMWVCSEIYGTANNFDMTDPKVADKILRYVLGGKN